VAAALVNRLNAAGPMSPDAIAALAHALGTRLTPA